ncbi:MAG TPA: phage tail tape measure protein [Epulopiscium sp.]|nr:phage tail tape measure protein [Candidatus Epulonipiscium sp.]
MKILQSQVSTTAEKLKILKDAQAEVNKQFADGKINEEQYRAFTREIEKTSIELNNLEGSADKAGNEVDELGDKSDTSGSKLSKLGSVAGKVASTSIKAVGTAFVAAGTAAVGLGAAALKVGSQFEAAMSQVKAISGASEEDFAKLEKAAKEMGATTMFSASQSAEALQYLALAGYDADKSITALPKVLDLAAAGNMELAYASDLVTDSMASLGLDMGKLNPFVDELAKTSQKSNTSVSQLGEAILTVGGTAKVLAGGTTELNTSLGILADNGIKGSEGGTALRNVILSLTAPTDKAAKAMDKLGVSAIDINGDMLPLNEVFKQFDQQLLGLTEAEKTNALNEIFNKTDLKSVNALLANSGERFDELSGHIKNANGAAAEMAHTMQDNLKGAITELKSGIEGLNINLYDFMKEPAKEVVQSITEMISEINEALMSGEDLTTVLSQVINKIFETLIQLIQDYLPQAVSVISEVAYGLITTLIGAIVENTPMLADVAATILVDFVTFICEALPTLLDAAIQIVITLANALTEKLPELIPVLVEGILNLVMAILDNLPAFIEAAIDMILALVEGILNALPMLLEQAPVIISKLKDSLIAAVPQLIDAAINIIISLAEFILNNLDVIIQTALELVIALAMGLITAIPELMMAAPKLVKAIVDVFIETNWGKVGLDLVKGIATGIGNGVGEAVTAAKKMANSVWKSITSVFDMKSPSRLAIRVFQKDFVEKGIGAGILKGIPEVVRDTKRMSESIIGVIKDVPTLDILPNMKGIMPAKSLSGGAAGSISNSYSGGDIIIQNMNINSKENAQYFAEYLYSLKKTRNRTVGAMT